MDEQRVLIVGCKVAGVQGDYVILNLNDGAQWGVPIPIFNQYCHVVLDTPVKEPEESK